MATAIEFLRPGDDLIVPRLDRLGRDTRDVLDLIHEAEQRGAFMTLLGPHVSTRGETGHVVLVLLGMVAQMERRCIKQRQREGIELARAEGVYPGGKRRFDRERIKLLHMGGSGPAAIARALGCSRMQVCQIATELGLRLPDLCAFEVAPEQADVARHVDRTALIDLIDECDELTADLVLDTVRLGVKLAKTS